MINDEIRKKAEEFFAQCTKDWERMPFGPPDLSKNDKLDIVWMLKSAIIEVQKEADERWEKVVDQTHKETWDAAYDKGWNDAIERALAVADNFDCSSKPWGSVMFPTESGRASDKTAQDIREDIRSLKKKATE